MEKIIDRGVGLGYSELMGSLFGAEIERAVNVHKSEMDSLYISDSGLGVL